MHERIRPFLLETNPMTPRLIRFNKPYGVLSQFTPEGKWQGLRDYIGLPGVLVRSSTQAGQGIAHNQAHLLASLAL